MWSSRYLENRKRNSSVVPAKRASLFSDKAFVFSLEALIALVLFVSFLSVAHFNAQEKNNYLKEIAVKNSLSDALGVLGETGFAQAKLDENVSTAGTAIYNKLSSLLPANVGLKVSISEFDPDVVGCRIASDFGSCFSVKQNFFSSPENVSDLNTSVVHDKAIFVSLKGPNTCTTTVINNITTAPFKDLVKKKKLSFAEYFAGINFASTPDFNIFFGTTVVPSVRASCDENIRVDLNAWLASDGNLYNRKQADVMLVLDKSGSMSWDGSLDLYSPQDVFVQGDYAFVADGSAGLKDINVQIDNNGVLMGTCVQGAACLNSGSGSATGIFVVGNTAYLADGAGGLKIINVANKASPVLLGSLSSVTPAARIAVKDDYAYIVTSMVTASATNPNVTGTANRDLNIGRAAPNDLNAAQSFKSVSSSIDSVGFWIKRVGSRNSVGNLTVHLKQSLSGSDITSVQISRNSVGTSYNWVTADFGGVAVNSGQTYYLVLTTTTTSGSNYYNWGGLSTNPYADGNAYRGGLLLSGIDALFRVNGTTVTPGELKIVDVSNSAAPVYRANVVETDPQDIEISGDYAYIADNSEGLKIINISNPLSPADLGGVQTNGALGVSVSGDYAYVAAGNTGLQIVNVSDKSHPFIVKTVDTPGSASDAFYYSDGNVYVADYSYLLGVNVSNPSAASIIVNYPTTASTLQRIFVSNDWAYLTPGYTTSLISTNVYIGPKINQVRASASQFIDFSGWKATYDQIGLVSFANSVADLNSRLRLVTDANKAILKVGVAGLLANGNTPMGTGILSATTELTSSRARDNGVKFMVLLSDGVANYGSPDGITYALDMASDANLAHIKIYTIAFGGDADTVTLKKIASDTNGKYSSANDANALSNVFNFIALDIEQGLSDIGKIKVNDSNIMVPLSIQVKDCENIIDINGGVCRSINDVNYLDYNVGVIDSKHPWSGSFTMKIPCDSNIACSIGTDMNLPFSGTTFWYADSNGVSRPLSWDSNQHILFDYRQLNFSVNSADPVGTDSISIDLTVNNTGTLDASNMSVSFYSGLPFTSPLISTLVPSLPLAPGHSVSMQNQSVNSRNFYVALVPTTGGRQWCPVTVAQVKCDGSASTAYYVVDAYAWIQ